MSRFIKINKSVFLSISNILIPLFFLSVLISFPEHPILLKGIVGQERFKDTRKKSKVIFLFSFSNNFNKAIRLFVNLSSSFL